MYISSFWRSPSFAGLACLLFGYTLVAQRACYLFQVPNLTPTSFFSNNLLMRPVCMYEYKYMHAHTLTLSWFCPRDSFYSTKQHNKNILVGKNQLGNLSNPFTFFIDFNFCRNNSFGKIKTKTKTSKPIKYMDTAIDVVFMSVDLQ